jgi:hypothetical protein
MFESLSDRLGSVVLVKTLPWEKLMSDSNE